MLIQFDKKTVVIALITLIFPLQAALLTQKSNIAPPNVSRSDQIHNFWIWFSKNQSRFSNLEQNRENLVPEIVQHLRKLSRNLTIEVEVPKSGVRVMAISADGVEVDFPLVQQLVATAPSMRGWQIVAFRQPGKLEDMELKYPGLTLNTSKMWIRSIENDHGFDLIIFFPDYSDDKRNLFINGTYVLLDNAIGEYNVVKGIRTLDFQKLPPANDRKGIAPFVDLPKIFASYETKHRN